MAKDLIFKIAGKELSAAPVKPDRKKIYGWTETIATSRDGAELFAAEIAANAKKGREEAL